MIPTLSDYLYIVNRDRAHLQDKLDKRRTFWMVCGITACVTIAVMLWIAYA